ncbi:MAG: hypothetical protein Q9226_004548, partial [Calogaya cf. arnoldii]
MVQYKLDEANIGAAIPSPSEIKGLLDLVSRFKEGNCIMTPEEVDEFCAICFHVCWSSIQSEERTGVSSQTAQQWLEDYVAIVGNIGKDQGLAEGPRLQQDHVQSEASIRRHWKVTLYDILPDRSCTKWILVRFAEKFADLALLIGLDDARGQIKQAINDRRIHTDNKDDFMCVEDVEAVLAAHEDLEKAPTAERDYRYRPPKRKQLSNVPNTAA